METNPSLQRVRVLEIASQDGRYRPFRRRIGRPVLVLVLFYAVGTAMLTAFQRTLIYHPDRQDELSPARAGLPPEQVQSVTVQTPEELRLHGWFIEAERTQQPATGYTVLFFSGNGGNRAYRVPELRLFTDLGADVLIVDYRGYGENRGTPSEKGLATDARALWNYATVERGIPPSRLVLYGESLGGAVTVELAASLCEDDRQPAAVALRSTFSSLVDVGQHHYPILPVRLLLADRYPSQQRISRLRCPLLQVHGTRDSIVPLEFGRRLFAAAPEESACGVEKQFVELPGAGHNDVLLLARAEIQRALEQFFARLAAEKHRNETAIR